MVNTDGTTYLEYEVRNVVGEVVTSDTLYLMQINPDNSSSSTILSATTQNETQYPGNIIPDGQGGVLATWSVSVVQGTQPTYPYEAVDFSGGTVGTPYNLPFSPQSVDITKQPVLVLGENGVAFAKGQTTVPINGVQTTVDQIASFNIGSGAANWTYQATSGDTLSIIVAATGNGLSVKTTDQNNNDTIISLDSTGAPVGTSWAGNNVDYFVGDRWTGMTTGSSTTEYSGPLIQFSTSGWFSPQQEKGNQAAQAMHVTNALSSGANQTTIASVFGKIMTALNSNPQSSCSTWMQGTGTDASVLIQSLLTANNFGHETFNLNNVAAFTYGTNPDKSPVGIPSNFSITVNDNGAFFNSKFTVGIRNYPGNGLRAQATILIHELSHLLSHANDDANLFQDDFGIPKAEKWNDTLVDQNCRVLIEGLQ